MRNSLLMRRAALVVTLLAGTALDSAAIPSRPPKTEPQMPWREDRAKPAAPFPGTPAPMRFFGIGIGFNESGTLAGVPLNRVIAGSPAARAGLVPGCVIVEINGQTTVGRPGNDCARIIQDLLGTVHIKYLDPALKEKTLTIEKEWITLSE